MDALSFLQSVAGFTQTQTAQQSENKPVKLGTIDPTYVASSFLTGTMPKVTFDGESTLSGKLYPVMSPYHPQPGDRVVMAPVGNTYLILGTLNAVASVYLGGQLLISQSGIGTAIATRTALGSAQPRFFLQTNGQQNWGDGTNVADTNLYRSGANTLKTDDAFDPASIVNEAKIAVTYQNGWVDWGAPYQGAKYWKDKNGVVHLDGTIKGGTITAGTTVFTLPAGYRPASTLSFIAVSGGSNVLVRLDIDSSGAAKVGPGSGWLTALVAFSAVNFKGEL